MIGSEEARAVDARAHPRPLPEIREGSFAGAAVQLAGLSALLLGWRPGEFWGATPAELEAVLAALAPKGEAAGAEEIARLMAMFPD